MFCHIFHAAHEIQSAHIIILSADTDVFILEVDQIQPVDWAPKKQFKSCIVGFCKAGSKVFRKSISKCRTVNRIRNYLHLSIFKKKLTADKLRYKLTSQNIGLLEFIKSNLHITRSTLTFIKSFSTNLCVDRC